MREWKILKNGKTWEDRIHQGEDWAEQTRQEYEQDFPDDEWTMEEMTEEEIKAYD